MLWLKFALRCPLVLRFAEGEGASKIVSAGTNLRLAESGHSTDKIKAAVVRETAGFEEGSRYLA